jgi:rfaE bifunctional protein kinase chain/domain
VTSPDSQRLLNIVDRFHEKRLAIVGDSIADRFVNGSISRVSREAPVFILKHESTQTIPGGAANCAMNLASLGAKTSLVSVVGDDEAGTELLEKLRSSAVDVANVQVSKLWETVTKVRILAGHEHSNRQQVIRVDYESEASMEEDTRQALRSSLAQVSSSTNAIIISDYNYGVVDQSAVEIIRSATSDRAVPVVVDSRFSLSKFQGFTAATPNEDEVEHLMAKRIPPHLNLNKQRPH